MIANLYDCDVDGVTARQNNLPHCCFMPPAADHNVCMALAYILSVHRGQVLHIIPYPIRQHHNITTILSVI